MKTLTIEEVQEALPTFTIEELRIGIRCRVRDMELAGQIGSIVEISIAGGHEQVWLQFDGREKPMGPWSPNEIHVLDAAAPAPPGGERTSLAQACSDFIANVHAQNVEYGGWVRTDASFREMEKALAEQPSDRAGSGVEARGKLRAMAMNYSDRHQWDHLDREVCELAANQIDSLERAVGRLRAENDALKAPKFVDEDGKPVGAGDRISFSYGIPPVKVIADVVYMGGELYVMSPGHNPDRCKMAELRSYVELFYKVES